MYHNNHQRLSNYISEPSPTNIRRSSSQHSYLNASTKYFQSRPSPRISSNSIKPIYSNSSHFHNGSIKTTTLPSAMENQLNNDPRLVEEYFGPEIKTIRNTLIDIRDHMRNREGQYSDKKNVHRLSKLKSSLMNFDENIYLSKSPDGNHMREKLQLRSKIEQKQQTNEVLLEQILELEHENNRLNHENTIIKQDLEKLIEKLNQCNQELDSQIKKYHKAETAKNEIEQKERELNLQLMDLRQNLLKSEEYLNQLAFNSRHQKESMAITEEFNVMINWKKDKDSYLGHSSAADFDIEKRCLEINEMQDQLCEKINGNLGVEKRIFSRIEQIDYVVQDLYSKLTRMQEEATKMSTFAY